MPEVDIQTSILGNIKKVLGFDLEDESFDADIIMHLNSTFSTLNQLGVGPEYGFEIQDATPTWSDYLDTSSNLNMVKSYMYLKVRLAFDPPQNSFGINAIKDQIVEYEWRLTVQVDRNRT